MPWCPNCKYEYKEGFTVCADCGAKLVDSLEEIEKEEEEREAMQLQEMQDQLALKLEEVGENLYSGSDSASENTGFVSAKDKADNYRSSGYALTIVGALGIVSIILYGLGVIKINMSDNIRLVSIVTLSVLFAFFLYMGIRSFLDARKCDAVSEEEESTEEGIINWFTFRYNASSIDEALDLKDSTLEEEIKYFSRIAYMKEKILEEYPQLERAYLDNLAENLYSMTYEH